MPRSPAMVSIGSPGTRRMRKKASRVIPTKVGIAMPIRVSAKRTMSDRGAGPTAPATGSLLDVDAVECVPRKRAQLEIDHFLAHRHQLHRMGDREPRRLFLEDDLRLAVKLCALGLVAHGLGLYHQILERHVAELGDIASVVLGRVAA